jgi:hypothetical protein
MKPFEASLQHFLTKEEGEGETRSDYGQLTGVDVSEGEGLIT